MITSEHDLADELLTPRGGWRGAQRSVPSFLVVVEAFLLSLGVARLRLCFSEHKLCADSALGVCCMINANKRKLPSPPSLRAKYSDRATGTTQAYTSSTSVHDAGSVCCSKLLAACPNEPERMHAKDQDLAEKVQPLALCALANM
jgi:hypothetical protein